MQASRRNARYLPEAELPLQLSVSADLAQAVAHGMDGLIVVADAGVGIPNELQSRIFEPFYSTQAGAGNGLGLSFCKNVVEDAHGKLSVHSQSGKGAVFTIELPLDRSDAPTRPPAPLSPDPCH